MARNDQLSFYSGGGTVLRIAGEPPLLSRGYFPIQESVLISRACQDTRLPPLIPLAVNFGAKGKSEPKRNDQGFTASGIQHTQTIAVRKPVPLTS